MCAHPPYGRRGDLRSKTAFPLRYHNGSDWPWLDGVYAGERLRRGLSGWRYPLVRWWEMCLAKGWLGAVEYYAPPWGRGSLLQGWSGLPAAVALQFRERVLKGDPDSSPGERRDPI
jgi:glycogen debranching enzyme